MAISCSEIEDEERIKVHFTYVFVEETAIKWFAQEIRREKVVSPSQLDVHAPQVGTSVETYAEKHDTDGRTFVDCFCR